MKNRVECRSCDREWDYKEGDSLECLCGGELVPVYRTQEQIEYYKKLLKDY